MSGFKFDNRNSDISADIGLVTINGSSLAVDANLVHKTGDETIAGHKTFTSPILESDGTNVLPSYTFTSSPATGIFSPAANAIGFSVSGTGEILRLTPTPSIDVFATTITSSTGDIFMDTELNVPNILTSSVLTDSINSNTALAINPGTDLNATVPGAASLTSAEFHLTGSTSTSSLTGTTLNLTASSGSISITSSSSQISLVTSTGVIVTGKVSTQVPSSSAASIRLPHGSAPSSPANGDMWTTTSGLFVQVNGSTAGPFSTTTGLPAGSDTQVQFNNSGSFGADSGFTYTSGSGISVASTSTPYIKLQATGGSTDEQNTLLTLGSGPAAYRVASATDAAPTTPVANLINGVRSGTAWTTLSLGNATNNTAFQFLGTGTITGGGKIQLADGTNTTPAFSFSNETGTGWYRGGSLQISAAVNGSQRLRISTSAMTMISTALLTSASASGGAGLNVPHGSAPSSPTNGDLWTTTTGLFVRINGSTVGPLISADGVVLTRTFTVNFNTSSPVTLFTTPTSCMVKEVNVIIDTAFDGTGGTLSVGVNGGSNSKYMTTAQNSLYGTATTVYTAVNGQAAASAEALEAYLTPGTATTGTVRVVIVYYTQV